LYEYFVGDEDFWFPHNNITLKNLQFNNDEICFITYDDKQCTKRTPKINLWFLKVRKENNSLDPVFRECPEPISSLARTGSERDNITVEDKFVLKKFSDDHLSIAVDLFLNEDDPGRSLGLLARLERSLINSIVATIESSNLATKFGDRAVGAANAAAILRALDDDKRDDILEKMENKKKAGEIKSMLAYQQKILFECPGTGKSHKVNTEILTSLRIEENSGNVIKCVFHPEYTYGDFMGKLMPLTQGDKVTYRFYPGHFLRALAQAYKNLINPANGKPEHVALVIDEINRGNTAAIFGSVIQLLDREDDGWSSYEVHLSDIAYHQLLSEIFGEDKLTYDRSGRPKDNIEKNPELAFINAKKIKLPSNFSIIGTMNTSDESIYYMDSAFKRRWDWEYVDLTTKDDDPVKGWTIDEGESASEWCTFVNKLNQFIKEQAKSIRRVEDKQIGYWFIKAKESIISENQIKNKLMFFLWDSVFQRDKSPLEDLLRIDKGSLVTFGDFTGKYRDFVEKISNYPLPKNGDTE